MSTIAQLPPSTLFLPAEKASSRSSLKERSFKQLPRSKVTDVVLPHFGKKGAPLMITPPLQGPFLVGHTAFVAKGVKHPVGVDVYGPTQKVEGLQPLEFVLYPGHPLGKTKRLFCTQSFAGLCPLEGKKFPVVIVSHGFGCEPGDYRPLCEEIASHGFIILALCHPFSSAYCSFPHSVEIDELPTQKVVEKQAKDIAFLVQSGRDKKGPAFQALSHIADFTHCFLLGHGLGGSACLMASHKVNAKGCINIDGEGETAAPLLTLMSGQQGPGEGTSFTTAGHDDFLVQPFLEQALGQKAASKTLQEAEKLIVDFLLKNKEK